MKGTRNESGTAKKQETRRGRIPTDSGARYRVTFVMVSAETSTSRRYTPVGTGRETSSDHQPTVNAVERVHDKFNLLASLISVMERTVTDPRFRREIRGRLSD